MRGNLPDLVLSDVMMPELDGFGLLAEIRADDRLKSVPFVMLSARAGEESRIGGLSAGADDYLVKPFQARELIARLASQLRLARASAAERRARSDADAARREMARVFEQAPVPICVIEGKELLYTTANASYRQIIGNRDPVGRALLELWPELDGSEIHKVFQQVLATGKPVSATEFPVQFDQFGLGTRRESYFNFVDHPLSDDEGRTRGIIAIATDDTAQVLARREADRLRQLAEEANAAKLHLLRTVSHETRQPVHASLGYLDLLTMGIRGELNEAQRSDIENVRRNQNHLLRLLNDILSFAKLEAGALQLDVEDADAGEIIAYVEPLVAQQFKAKGVEYKVQRPDAPAKFRGDRERTVQVCVNLLTNALKATPAGGSVTLSCVINPTAVALVVADTGVGIPSNKLQEIFDPFTQLARVRSSADAGGVGLGLSISRQLARAMRGDVTVESTLGAGSRFTFVLPRA
jgi:signal transduction histidine kinase